MSSVKSPAPSPAPAHACGMLMTDSDTELHSANHDDTERSAEGSRGPAAERADKKADGSKGGKAPDQSGDKTQERVDQEARKKRRPLIMTIGAVVVLLLIAGGLY